MGLHLNFELRLPGDTPREHVRRTLERLRVHASRARIEGVTRLFTARPPELPDVVGSEDRLERFFWLWASVIAHPPADHPDAEAFVGDDDSAMGFVVVPGRGSEVAPFGFYRRRERAGSLDEWHWHTSCKTQYASVVSEAHLITVHTTLVALLDHAIDLGIGVDVRDETGYWQSRDVGVLLESVRKMNRIVAMLAGKLSDAFPTQRVQSPILDHPRFEWVEMGE